MAINRSQTNATSASNATLSSPEAGTASVAPPESKNADPVAFARRLLYRRSSDPDESAQLRTALSAAEESFAETAAYYGRPVSFYGFNGAGPTSPYPRSVGQAGMASPFTKSPRQYDQRGNTGSFHQREVSDVSTVSGEGEFNTRDPSARLHRALDAAQYGNAEAGPTRPPVRPFLKTYGTESPHSSAMSPSLSGPGLRRKRSDRQSEEQKALAKLLKMYEQSAKEVQTLQAKQTEMETNLVIAQSNLVLAENHAEVLEDTIKRNSQARLSGGAFTNSAAPSLTNGAIGAKRTSGSRSPALGNSSTFVTTTDADNEANPPSVPSPRLGGFWRRAAAAASGSRATAVTPSGTSSTLSSVIEQDADCNGRGSASYDGSSEDEPTGFLRKPSMPMLRSTSGASQSAAREKEAKAQAGVIATLQEKLTTLQSEHTALQLEYSTLRDERDSINKRYTSLQEEIENLSVSLFEEANTMVAEERRLNSFLNEQLDRAKEEVEELHREVERLKSMSESTSDRQVIDTSASESSRATMPQGLDTNAWARSLQHRQSVSSINSGFGTNTRGSRRRSSIPALEILEHAVSASPRRGSRDVAAVAAAMAALARGEPMPDMPDRPSARRSLSISSAHSHRQPLTASSDSSNPLTAVSDSGSSAERSNRWPDLSASKRGAQLTAPLELDESPSKDRVGLAFSPEMQSSPPRPRRSSDRARQRSLSRSQSQRLKEKLGRSSSSSASDDAMSDGGSTPLKTTRTGSATASRPQLISRSSSSATATSQTRSERSNSNASSTASSARHAASSQASRPPRSSSRLTAHLEMSPNPDAELATPVVPVQRSRQFSQSGQTPLAPAQDAFNRMSSAVEVTPRPPSQASVAGDPASATQLEQPAEFDELFAQIQRDVNRMGVPALKDDKITASPVTPNPSIANDVGPAVSPSNGTISDGRSLRTKAAWNRGVRSPTLSESTSPRLASPAAFFNAPQPFSSPANVEEAATTSAALEFEFDLPFSHASPNKNASTATSTSTGSSVNSSRSPYRPTRALAMSNRSLSSTTSSSSSQGNSIPSSTLSDPSGSISRPNIPSSISLPPSESMRQTTRPPLNSANSVSSTSSMSVGLGLQNITAGASHPTTPISPFPLPTPPPFKRFPESNSYREPFYSPRKATDALPPLPSRTVPPRPAEMLRGLSLQSAHSTMTGDTAAAAGGSSSSSHTTSIPMTLTRSESNQSVSSTTSSLSQYLNGRHLSSGHTMTTTSNGQMDRTNSGFSVNDDLDTLMKSIDAINESLGSPAQHGQVHTAWMR